VRAASRGHGGEGIACGAWTRGGLQRDGRLGMPSSVTGARQSAGLGQRLDRDSMASLVRCLVVARVALHSGRWPVTGLVDCLWMCAVRHADGLMHHNQPPETPRSPGGRTLPARTTSTRRTRAGQRVQAMRRASWGRDTAITHSLDIAAVRGRAQWHRSTASRAFRIRMRDSWKERCTLELFCVSSLRRVVQRRPPPVHGRQGALIVHSLCAHSQAARRCVNARLRRRLAVPPAVPG
jgi:hypothetical protein